ncbi:MAG: peptidylprolyl isomerase [Dissulfurispiraceae bacterium]
MKKNVLFLLLATLILPSLLRAADDTVLARLGERTITVSDLNRIIGYQDEEQQKMYEAQPQKKGELITKIVEAIVVAKIAKEQGFDKLPATEEQLDMLVDDFLSSNYEKTEIASKVTVTEDEVKHYYEIHPAEFSTEGAVKVSHIFFAIDITAGEKGIEMAREKAEDALKRIRAGEDFAKVASEVSEDSRTKGKSGNLGYLRKNRMGREFDNVAFGLKQGETSGIVRTRFGFEIIKVDERNERFVESYEKARDKIRQKLLLNARTALIKGFVDKAMKEAGAEINLRPLNIPAPMPRGH